MKGGIMKRVSFIIPEEDHKNLKLISVKTGETMTDFILHCIRERHKQLEEEEKKDNEMAQIIERLRKERIETVGDYRQKGYEAGVLWAKKAHYDGFQAFLEWDSKKDPVPIDEELFFLASDIEEAMDKDEDEHYINMNFSDLKNKVKNEFNDEYIAGLVEGVNDFWNKVKDKI
jgi:hypothetical protein